MTIALRGMAPLLQVFDMPTSFRFYRDVLGFEVVSDSGGGARADWVWLRHGEVHLMLNTAYEAVQRAATRASARRWCSDSPMSFTTATGGGGWSPRRAP